MGLEIIERESLGADAWDGLAAVSDEAWLWHLSALQLAKTTWGQQDLSLAVLDGDHGGRLAAIFPLQLISVRAAKGLAHWKQLEALGSVAYAPDTPPKARARIWEALESRVRDLACQHGAVCLDFMLSPLAPAYRGENCPRVNPLLALGCQNTLTQTWVVDLCPGIERVWDAFEGRARTSIRKAEKGGVVVREAGAEDLDVYYKLHLETYHRTGAAPHPRAYFEAIWKHFLAAGLSRVYIAEMDGQAVAADNFGVYKDAAIYWTGASSEKGLAANANYLIQWEAIQWMVANGVQYYEAGEAFPHLHAGKLKGLNDFKKSFGGSLCPIYRGRLVLNARRQALLEAARSAKAVMGRGA